MKTDIQVRSPKSVQPSQYCYGEREVRKCGSRFGLGGSPNQAESDFSMTGALRLSVVIRLLLALVVTVGLTGCFGFLKPVRSTSRHFVLTPLPVPQSSVISPGSVPIGVGQVKIASYLFNSSFAIRRGTNEIDYSSSTIWAERLDVGLQRVLAANLAILMPTDQVRLSSWQTTDVAVELYVAVERFDVDANGQAVLVAWWRLVSPGGEILYKGGEARLTRQGPQPDADPAGAIATLSGLAADLSRQLADEAKAAAAAAKQEK